MKCAGPVIRTSIGRAVARSKVPVNHALRSRSSHEMVTRLGVRCSTYAFAIRTLQDGMGCDRSVDVDSSHGAPARKRSQRVRLMTIPSAPPEIAYSTLFGASSFHVVKIVCPGPEERRSV